MINYNNILIEYFKANDTEFKKLVNIKFEESKISRFIQFMDGFFCKIGIMSCDIKPIENGKWETYYMLGHDNMFTEESKIVYATDKPIKRKEAELLLANQVIGLLTHIDMSEVSKRINVKTETTGFLS